MTLAFWEKFRPGDNVILGRKRRKRALVFSQFLYFPLHAIISRDTVHPMQINNIFHMSLRQ